MYTQLHWWFQFPLNRRSLQDKSKTSSRYFFFVMCLLISISPQAMLDIALLADNAKNMRYCLQVQNYPQLLTRLQATQIVKIFFVEGMFIIRFFCVSARNDSREFQHSRLASVGQLSSSGQFSLLSFYQITVLHSSHSTRFCIFGGKEYFQFGQYLSFILSYIFFSSVF